MTLRKYPTRLLFAAALSSLLLLGLCGTMAAYISREASRTYDALGEDIDSRRVAADLEETLRALVAQYRRGAGDFSQLHEKIEEDLAQIARYANKDQEREYARLVANSYDTYLRMASGRELPDARRDSLIRFLEYDTIPTCKDLRIFNSSQIEESERDHGRSLHSLAWGLAVVGGLASAGGLVLGYGLARGLRQTIHQFLVRVQGAADLLGQELPVVEWQQEGQPLDDGAEDLFRRVEQVVLALQQREREVRRADQLAGVGRLAASMAHEIRNPLTSVILLIQTSRRDPTAGGLTAEDLDLIEGELHRIEASLQAFLDFARPPRLERAPCELPAVVKDALNLARGRIAQQRVEVEFEDRGDGHLLADREQLRQVVLNLLLNALDAMPHGGTLGVTIRPPGPGGLPGAWGRNAPDAPGAWGRSAPNAIELAVTDTGPGIPPEILARLFQPFATGKDTGMGLGLVVSKRIVEGHGGSIAGFNQLGGGACFVVRLPVLSGVGGGQGIGGVPPPKTPGPNPWQAVAQAADDSSSVGGVPPPNPRPAATTCEPYSSSTTSPPSSTPSEGLSTRPSTRRSPPAPPRKDCNGSPPAAPT